MLRGVFYFDYIFNIIILIETNNNYNADYYYLADGDGVPATLVFWERYQICHACPPLRVVNQTNNYQSLSTGYDKSFGVLQISVAHHQSQVARADCRTNGNSY